MWIALPYGITLQLEDLSMSNGSPCGEPHSHDLLICVYSLPNMSSLHTGSYGQFPNQPEVFCVPVVAS